jgi:hypothetical protein
MKSRQIGRWNVEVDESRTKDFYSNYHEISRDCSCQGCRNYVSSCTQYSEEVKQFFQWFGIDATKEAEVYVCAKNDDGTILYGGFYHVVGTLISGEDYWHQDGKENSYAEPYKLNDNFSYGFTKGNALVPEGFPEPILQLEFMASLPWILEEECRY